MAIARNDPRHFHINLRIAVDGEDCAKEKSLSAISLTRQLDRECGIDKFEEVMPRRINRVLSMKERTRIDS